VARFNCPFILLAPTNHHMDLRCHELLTRVRAGFFPLDCNLRLSDYGTLLPTRLPGEIFATFRPDPSGSVSEEIARQLIALVKALAVKYRFRKAPLYIVFLLYCADGRTVNQIARDCHCDPSLIFSRLKLLHRKLGRHPAELRQYSDHLDKVAASLSDPRARRIHRKRAINGDDQEGDA
jgi:hypothetical protein